jgi:hypothetical protein
MRRMTVSRLLPVLLAPTQINRCSLRTLSHALLGNAVADFMRLVLGRDSFAVVWRWL